ncbi:MAG: hypothetical protein M0Q13_09810 [Methanothrix sp.]|jgi:hypothetical protein|nr:hypothetical protein [Methanothrix sp.]
MEISVGCFFNIENDLYKLEKIANSGINCHLSFFHYEDFVNLRRYVPRNLKITSLHAFNSDRNDSINDYILKIDELKSYFKTMKVDQNTEFMVTVHPNHFGEEFSNYNYLYPENFKYKKKKKLLTPIHILKTCGRMTLDTSHLEEEWFNSEQLFRHLLMNTDILHFSQRENNSTKSEHKPINYPGVVPTGFILKTLRQFNVKEIVLEYMPEFIDRAISDYKYLNTVFKI